MLNLRKVLGNCVHMIHTKNYVRSYFSYLNSSYQITNVLACLELSSLTQIHTFREVKHGGKKEEEYNTKPSTSAELTFIIFYTLITFIVMKHCWYCLMVFSSLHKHFSIELSTRMEIFSNCITIHGVIATSYMWVLRTWCVTKKLNFYFNFNQIKFEELDVTGGYCIEQHSSR